MSRVIGRKRKKAAELHTLKRLRQRYGIERDKKWLRRWTQRIQEGELEPVVFRDNDTTVYEIKEADTGIIALYDETNKVIRTVLARDHHYIPEWHANL